MLEKLVIRNFQKHKKFTLGLDPHVTVLVGPSDRGKSSLLRALRWLCFNKPSGEEFITHGQSHCSVDLYYDDGRRITRHRGDRKNYYTADGEEYHALGTSGVPEQVVRLLNLGEINFQRQHDPSFWFSLTPGEVAREINQIVNLELIDKVLGKLSSQHREDKSRVTLSQERIDKAKKQVKELSWVTKADSELQKIEALEQDMASRSHRIASMASILAEMDSCLLEQNRASKAKSVGEKILGLLDKLERLSRQRKELKDLCEKICLVQKETEILKANLEQMKEKLATQQICPLCGASL